MSKIKITYILLFTVVASLTMLYSCSDDTKTPDEEKFSIRLTSCGISKTENKNNAKTTRALPSGYEKYSVLYPNAENEVEISAILVNESNVQSTGSFKHVSGTNTWTSNIFAHSVSNYYIYGFMPAARDIQVSVTSTDYTQGATMTVKGMEAAITDDVCVVVGVKTCTDKNQDIADSGIVPGEYLLIPSKKETEYIHLLFDHIYSCMALQFLVDDDYNSLRTIKIKKVTLQALSGPTSADATITLPYGNPASAMSISWTTQGTDGMTINNLLASNKVITLSTDIQEVPCYFAPQESFVFNLTTEYDVYDKKDNLIRESCKATNKITSPQLESGKKHPIKLKVQPTYLYQLSEPDLDNPTIVTGT